MSLDRRAFLHSSLAAAAPLVLPWRPRAEPFRVGLLVPASGNGRDAWLPSALRGARFGAEEAAHTYALLGRAVELVEQASSTGMEGVGSTAAISLLDDPRPGDPGAMVIDARARYRASACAAGAHPASVFRVGIDESTATAALTLDAEAEREVAELASPAARDQVVLWHGALSRFGASQLNERFERRFATPMDEHAWAAWIAVKVLTESALRVADGSPVALAARLTRAGVRFDGHKGSPLSFDTRRRLVQPIYRLSGHSILQLSVAITGENGC